MASNVRSRHSSAVKTLKTGILVLEQKEFKGPEPGGEFLPGFLLDTVALWMFATLGA